MPEENLGVCIILIKDNHILLGKRKNSYKAGWYGLPGGRLELKESLLDCVRRELKEEINVEAVKIEYVGVVRELQGNYNFVHFAFVCTKWQGELCVMEPDKCEGWEWFDVEKLPTDILPGHQAAIKLWKNAAQEKYQDLFR